MNNDDSSDHVGDDVNINVGSNELKVIDSRPDADKNDIGNYLSNKLSIDDNFKYPLVTLLDQKKFWPIIFFDTREVCPLF